MRDFDRRATTEFGIPSLDFMESAGRAVFEAVCDLISGVRDKNVVVIAGKGNNGGDGFVTARLLREAGADVSALVLADPSEIAGDARVNLDKLRQLGQEIQQILSGQQAYDALKSADAVVDAIFGTGLHGAVTGLAEAVIMAINRANRPTVAVDIPSGMDADTGKVLGACVAAEVTVTFALPKIGLVMYPGAEYVGKLIVADIGIPHDLYREVNVSLVSKSEVKAAIPHRPADGHKGTFGTCLVFAGSAGYTGAAALSSEAALRVGAGLSILAVPQCLQDIMSIKLTEVITRAMPETQTHALSDKALGQATALCDRASSIALGCGIGTDESTRKFVQEFVRSVSKPMVIDADGLNCLAGASVLEGEHGPLVITPHPGEMGRLLGKTTAEIQADRLASVKEAAARFHCVAILKGARTLVAEPGGHVFLNPTGNSGMATAGTGDVLAGMIGGLLSQGCDPLWAAVSGVYIHGLAGDIAAASIGPVGFLARDVLQSIPTALDVLNK
jgi:NAD(P)H-hydrate epimerase